MNMTDNEIRIAIAEACGWKKEYTFTSQEFGSCGEEVQAWISPSGETSVVKIPNYPADLNAMAEAEKYFDDKPEDLRSLYYNNILLAGEPFANRWEREWALLRSTARQRGYIIKSMYARAARGRSSA